MKHETSNLVNQTDWAAFQEQLAHYVRLELAGAPADEVYPEIAFYIENSNQCKEAYQLEFRSQGLTKSLEKLQQHSGQTKALATINQLFPAIKEFVPDKPQPASSLNWYAKATDWGYAWLDQLTHQWRLLDIPLFTLPSRQQPATAAMSGFMRVSTTQGYTLLIEPHEANFELTISVVPDATHSDQCQVIADISLFDRMGDFSGVEMTLLWGEDAPRSITDLQGKVTFANLPASQLGNMRLKINLPD
jgi:hypothetical protein